jgi:hypothetical protein
MFTHNEKVDMLLIYGEAKKNALAARRLYAERYPERNHPNHKIFTKLENSLRQNHVAFSIKKVIQRTVRTDENVAIVINYFQTHHGSSIREASRELHLTYSSIQRVLKDNKFHDYKINNLQELILNVEKILYPNF